MKRRKGNACFLCEKDKQECDGNRPCARCFRLNTPQMCLGLEIQRPTPATSIPNNVRTVNATQVSQVLNTPTKPTSTFEDVKTDRLEFKLKEEKPTVQVNLKKEEESTSFPIQSSSRTFNFLNSNPRPSYEPPKISNQQMSINSFLMAEIKKLKDDQKRMNEEMLALKLQNMKLSAKVETLDSSNMQLSTSNPLVIASKGTAYQGMVVFDLMKKPAIVLTANEAFCNMLGYDMKEVLGMPWHKFIHPDYLDRTMRILSETGLKDSQIQFEQVYKRKTGESFPSLDTHSLFFSNGQPVSDLVFIQQIKLPPNHPAYTSSRSSGLLLQDKQSSPPSSPPDITSFPFTSTTPESPQPYSLSLNEPQTPFTLPSEPPYMDDIGDSLLEPSSTGFVDDVDFTNFLTPEQDLTLPTHVQLIDDESTQNMSPFQLQNEKPQ